MDVLLWMLGKNDSRRRSGVYYLNAYKDAYVQYNRDKIIKHAYAAGIRPELLGGVAWIESGGMPENYKFQIYETKRMMGLLDMPENKNIIWLNGYTNTNRSDYSRSRPFRINYQKSVRVSDMPNGG